MLRTVLKGTAVAVFGLVMFAAAANAATVVANQNLKSDGTAVAADRSVLANATDDGTAAELANMFSLGMEGFIALDTGSNVLVSPVFTIERTNGAPSVGSYPEAVDLYLGGTLTGTGLSDSNSYTGGTRIATLLNDGSITNLLSGVLIDVVNGVGTTAYTVNFGALSGLYSVVALIDATLREYASSYTGSIASDGWDVTSFRIEERQRTPSEVPLPAGIILLLSGLLGMGFLGRFRAKIAG